MVEARNALGSTQGVMISTPSLPLPPPIPNPLTLPLIITPWMGPGAFLVEAYEIPIWWLAI